MIQFSSVAKRYPGGHEALRGVTLDVADGEMVAAPRLDNLATCFAGLRAFLNSRRMLSQAG